MICLILYWYWLLWDWTNFVQEARALFCIMSTMELGAELVVLIVCLFDYLGRKGVIR